MWLMTSGRLFQLLVSFALKNATMRTHTLERTHILCRVWGDFPFAHIWWHKFCRLSLNNFTFLHFSMMIGGIPTAESDTLCRKLHTCMYVLVTSTLTQTEWGLFPPPKLGHFGSHTWHVSVGLPPIAPVGCAPAGGAWIIWLLTPVSLLPAGGRSLIVQKGLRHI